MKDASFQIFKSFRSSKGGRGEQNTSEFAIHINRDGIFMY